MKKSAAVTVLIAWFLTTTAAAPQVSHMPKPPEAAWDQTKDPSTAGQDRGLHPRHIDPFQLRREADELARTAQTIPADVDSVRKGMLPKDVIQKLKQIEKLSKRLRSELNP